MAYRKRMSRSKSRRSFKRNAGVHPRNAKRVTRGGYRL